MYDIWSLPSLQQLIAAALPPCTRASQLCGLSVYRSILPLSAVHSCPFLGHLTSLNLSFCCAEDNDPGPVVDALLQQAPRLLSLTFLGWLPANLLPLALVSRTGLQHIKLGLDNMTELPAGPYLSSE